MRKRWKWGLLYVGVFIFVFIASAVVKVTWTPLGEKYSVDWDESVGTVYTDIPYREGEANKFDLYVPADRSREAYGLVVYLHAGGFTSGDKRDDAEMLRWLCSKGYVAAGINYTLFSEEHPEANVCTQSLEIRESIPFVAAEAERLGCKLDGMAVSGGSAGHALAMLYAYRDGPSSPLPVRLVFGAVGPSSYYPEDWTCFGFDRSPEAAADMFSVMSGREITPEMFGTEEYEEVIRDISAVSWIDGESAPSVLAYGAHDRMQPFPASGRLAAALEEHGVEYEYIVFEHSGHGLQNDNRRYAEYMERVEEYLERYLPVE